MAKKKTVTKKPTITSSMAEINQLHSCIANDQNKLTKLYKKAFAESAKKLVAINKAFLKAKKMVDQAVKSKKNAPKSYISSMSLFQSLKNELVAERTNITALKAGYQRFNMQQKAIKQIEKSLDKSVKMSAKVKRRIVQKPRIVKNAKKETPALHSPISIDESLVLG